MKSLQRIQLIKHFSDGKDIKSKIQYSKEPASALLFKSPKWDANTPNKSFEKELEFDAYQNTRAESCYYDKHKATKPNTHL